MTNRVIKDYHKNKPIHEFVQLNYKIMCMIMLTANKLYPKTFYPKAINEFFSGRVEYCDKSNDYEKNDVLAYKMEQACEELGLLPETCITIARTFSKAEGHNYSTDAIKILAHNIELVFIQLNYEYGLGKERRERLISELLSDTSITEKPIERIAELGVRVDNDSLSQIDYRKLKIKPDKITFAEQKEAAKALEWLRSYQSSVRGGVNNG